MTTDFEPSPDYRIFNEEALRAFLAGKPRLAMLLGGIPADWQIEEKGDGNINLVFFATGPYGGLVVKQALPYIRVVGESWPLPLARIHFEQLALASQQANAPGMVPEVLDYDPVSCCITMGWLKPHIIMRRGMIDGVAYPCFADHVSTFLARTLFCTSSMGCTTADHRAAVAAFNGNHTMCQITESVIFVEPLSDHPNNSWTQPQLDNVAARLRADAELKAASLRFRQKFRTETQALLHGDLHTGSIMVTEDDTRMIDAEFAFYGPMAFDIGKLVANLLISYFAQAGHEQDAGDRDDYRRWILDTIAGVWDQFQEKFIKLWQDSDSQPEAALPAGMFPTPEDKLQQELVRIDFCRALFTDALGFAGCCIIRRILGIAHNIDLEEIADPQLKATCEARALELARTLLVDPAAVDSVGGLLELAGRLQGQTPEL